MQQACQQIILAWNFYTLYLRSTKHSCIGEQSVVMVGAPTRLHSVHKTQLCWGTKHSCILYPNAAVVCTPTRPHFVPQCSCDLYTNTAKFYAPTRPRFVHRMRPWQCTNNS